MPSPSAGSGIRLGEQPDHPEFRTVSTCLVGSVSGGEDPRINGAGLWYSAPFCDEDAVVLAAVQDASRRLRRCPSGILDRRCARRRGERRSGRQDGRLDRTTGWLLGIVARSGSGAGRSDGQKSDESSHVSVAVIDAGGSRCSCEQILQLVAVADPRFCRAGRRAVRRRRAPARASRRRGFRR